MPRLVSQLLALLLWIGLWLTPASQASATALAPLRIVLGADTTGDQCQGPLAALLNELLTVRSQIAYQCDTAPWARAQTLVREHKRDALITTRNADRDRYTIATQIALIEAPLQLYTRYDHPRLAELQTIRKPLEAAPFRVLSYRGDSWAEQQLIAMGLPVDWSKDSSTVLKKLAAGRGDIYFQNRYDTDRLLRHLRLEQEVIALPTRFGTIARFLLIDRDSAFAADVERINYALHQMQQDGSLQRLQQAL